MKIGEEVFISKRGKEIIIRESSEEDASDLLRHAKQVRAETDFLLTTPEEIGEEIEEQRSFINMMKEDSKKLLLVALYQNKIIASAAVSPVLEKSKTIHRASFGIAVEEEYWQEGLGKQISQMAILFAKQHYLQLELGVYEKNERARQLYQQLGFQEWAKIPRAFYLKNGTYENELVMGILFQNKS